MPADLRSKKQEYLDKMKAEAVYNFKYTNEYPCE